MEVRALKPADDRAAFRSGDLDLDRFFAKYAGQNQFRHHVGTTYVAVEAAKVLGYATVAAGQVESDTLPLAVRRRLPGYPLPVLRLARLAVDESAQERGVGKALLRHVLALAVDMSAQLGCVGVVVDAKVEAVSYYARFGFTPLEVAIGNLESRPEPQPMFLPIALVEDALGVDPR